MRVLMSIKPEFVKKIASGEKTFEFRKILFKCSGIKTIVVYASSPVSKIVGEFNIDNILTDEPSKIWYLTHEKSGISKKYFDDYFHGKPIAHAISISSFKKYPYPRPLSYVNVLRAPQSFCYIK